MFLFVYNLQTMMPKLVNLYLGSLNFAYGTLLLTLETLKLALETLWL